MSKAGNQNCFGWPFLKILLRKIFVLCWRTACLSSSNCCSVLAFSDHHPSYGWWINWWLVNCTAALLRVSWFLRVWLIQRFTVCFDFQLQSRKKALSCSHLWLGSSTVATGVSTITWKMRLDFQHFYVVTVWLYTKHKQSSSAVACEAAMYYLILSKEKEILSVCLTPKCHIFSWGELPCEPKGWRSLFWGRREGGGLACTREANAVTRGKCQTSLSFVP